MKKINFLMLFALVFLLFSCREESLITNSDSDIQKSTVTNDFHKRFPARSFISSETLKKQLKSSEIKSTFENNARQFKDNSFSKTQFADILIYERIEDLQKNIVTYSLPLIDYSSKNPYFLKHVITVQNNVEREGFIKIIPNNPPVSETEGLNNFSGIIQILDKNMGISSQRTYLNGVPQNVSGGTSTASKMECYNVIELITHTCTNGDHHLPGQTCDNGMVNDAYYELITTVVCKEQDEHLAPLEPVITSSNGGGGATMIYKVLNHPNFLYTNYISQGDKLDLLNMVSNWAVANNTSGSSTVDDAVITQLNQMVGIFANNDSLFSDFATLQDLFDNANFYLQGTGSYFDTRIKNLIQYLFENPTQENADFVNWATQFFINNTTPNGYCSVTWNQFQNWFMGTSEGRDGEDYDAVYWDDPNLTFPVQNLPTLQDFKNAYPKNYNGTFEMEYANVYNLVGGIPKALRDEVLNDNNPNNDRRYDNACALRTSRALNYSGVVIPNIPGKTFKGGDGKYYFLGARNLYNWMKKTFPPTPSNSIVLSGAQGGLNGQNFPSLLQGYQGIYILLPVDGSELCFGASGHAGIYTSPDLTHYYFNATCGVSSITLWILN